MYIKTKNEQKIAKIRLWLAKILNCDHYFLEIKNKE